MEGNSNQVNIGMVKGYNKGDDDENIQEPNVNVVHYVFGVIFAVLFFVSYIISTIKAIRDRRAIKARMAARMEKQEDPACNFQIASPRQHGLIIVHDFEREKKLKGRISFVQRAVDNNQSGQVAMPLTDEDSTCVDATFPGYADEGPEAGWILRNITATPIEPSGAANHIEVVSTPKNNEPASDDEQRELINVPENATPEIQRVSSISLQMLLHPFENSNTCQSHTWQMPVSQQSLRPDLANTSNTGSILTPTSKQPTILTPAQFKKSQL